MLIAACAAIGDFRDHEQAIERAQDLAATLDTRQVGLICSWSEALRHDEVDMAAVGRCLAGMAADRAAHPDPFARIAPHEGYAPNAAMRAAIIRGSGR